MLQEYESCEKIIRYHANKFRNYYDIEDLMQVGRIGLENAKRNYDETKNTKFTTFAYIYIKGEILRYVRDSHLIQGCANYDKINMAAEKAREMLRQRLMREPTNEEVALFCEIDEKLLEEAQLSSQLVRSLDYVINEDDDGKELQLYDQVAYIEKGYQDDILDLKNALGELSEEEQRLIKYRFYEGMTQQEISEILGVNQVKVSRQESKILEKLKQQL